MFPRRIALLLTTASSFVFVAGQVQQLPSTKRLGHPAKPAELVNSMPSAIASSPDGRYIAIVHTGYGSTANGGRQSITLIEIANGSIHEYNEDRLKLRAKQTYSFGIAFSADSSQLYVPFASTSDPLAKAGGTGNGIGVYQVRRDGLSFERMIPLPLVELAAGKRPLHLSKAVTGQQQVPFPAGIARFTQQGREKLVVAEQLSDTLAFVDVASGRLESRIDIGQNATVPSAYPYNVVVDESGKHAYVSLWNASLVLDVDCAARQINRRFVLLPPDSPTGASSHPAALALNEQKGVLYVALANRDEVAAVQLATGNVQYASTASKTVPFAGLYPSGIALDAARHTLFVSNASQNSVALLDVSGETPRYRGAFPRGS